MLWYPGRIRVLINDSRKCQQKWKMPKILSKPNITRVSFLEGLQEILTLLTHMTFVFSGLNYPSGIAFHNHQSYCKTSATNPANKNFGSSLTTVTII